MKKRFILMISIVLFFSFVSADTTCPFGVEDDPYPGQCGRYVDQDHSGYCDYSESEDLGSYEEANHEEGRHDCDDVGAGELPGTALKSMTIEQVANYYNINSEDFVAIITQAIATEVDPNVLVQYYHDEYGLRSAIVKDIAKSLQNTDQHSSFFQNLGSQGGGMYRWILGVILVLIYAFYFLFQKKVSLSKKFLNGISYILLPVGSLVRVVYIGYLQKIGSDVFDVGRVLGYVCVWLFFVIMIAKPICMLRGCSSKKVCKGAAGFTKYIVSIRKQLGILVFWLAFTHALVYFLFWLTRDSALFDFFQLRPFLMGLLGLVGLLVGFLTSNTYSIMKLKKYWKPVQMVAYPALVLSVVHIFLINPWRGGILLVLLVLYGILKIFEQKNRQKK